MKRAFNYIIAFTTVFIGHSQNTIDDQEFEKQLQKTLAIQLKLLNFYNNQIEAQVELIQKQYDIEESKKTKAKEAKPKIVTHANFEAIIGVTDNEGLGYHGNFGIEINTEKHNGVEMGVFYDNNDMLTNVAEIPLEIFILNLGYTKQLNFLSNKTETISIRLAMGGCFGAEVLNKGKDQLSTGAILKTKGGVIYGGYFGFFSLFKINSKFSVIFRNSNYITTSDVSTLKFIVGTGLRFSF